MARYIDADKIPIYFRYVTDGDGHRSIREIAFSLDIKLIPTADVVPKSEADKWHLLYHSIKGQFDQEERYHAETEKLCDRYCIEAKAAKQQTVREIIERITKVMSPDMQASFIPIFGKDALDYEAGVSYGRYDAIIKILVEIAKIGKEYEEVTQSDERD